jgi:hypothetical protein
LAVELEFAEDPQPESPSEHTKSASTKTGFMDYLL